MKKLFVLTTLMMIGILPIASIPVRGDVLDSAADGFTSKHTLTISVPPSEVYSQFINIGRWWDAEHSYSGVGQNMTIEDRINGCFCEKLESGGEVRHMTIVFRDPGKTLRMLGGLGPLQELGVTGSLTLSLAKADNGTTANFTYVVGGYRAGGLQSLAPLVDKVLLHQFTRFKDHVEKRKAGTPKQ
ncbi:MAG: ATPase [Pyrinomonadaceae bacterium]